MSKNFDDAISSAPKQQEQQQIVFGGGFPSMPPPQYTPTGYAPAPQPGFYPTPPPGVAFYPPAMSESLEELVRRVAGKAEFAHDCKHLKPNIPEKKKRNAIRKSKAPADTDVWMLIDATVFGSADNALILAPTGLWCHNDWSGKTSGSHFVSWADFAATEVKSDGSYNTHIGNGSFFDVAGAGCGSAFMTRLLTAIQSELRMHPDLLRR